MSRTVALVIGALVVVAAGIALVVMLASGEETAEPTKGESVSVRKSVPPPRDPGVVVTDTPRLPADQRPAGDPGDQPREYAVGDVRVRDHRSGDHAPLDIPPNPHPANARLIPSTLTHAISLKVREVMTECTRSVPADARAEKPRMEGQITISIKDQQLAVQKATLHLRNMSGPAADAAKQCLEQKAIGLATPAADEADLDGYTINLSAAIPSP